MKKCASDKGKGKGRPINDASTIVIALSIFWREKNFNDVSGRCQIMCGGESEKILEIIQALFVCCCGIPIGMIDSLHFH